MKKYILFILGCFCVMGLSSQSSLIAKLEEQGFENLSYGRASKYDWFTFEDRVHRNTYQGIADAIQLLVDDDSINKDVAFIVLDKQIPQVKVTVSYLLMSDYRKGLIALGEVYQGVNITYDTDDYRESDALGEVYNHSAGTVDVVLYPEVMLANYRLDKLYVVSVNLAPAVEVALWRGAKLTGQVIFPVFNNLKGEVDYIRPGVLSLSQSFRLQENVFGQVSAGNFTNNRMGMVASLGYKTNNGRFGLAGDLGITGSSTFYGGRWEVATWKRVNASVVASYYEPHYNLQFDLSFGRYVYGDRGGRMDCTRHFGEVSVGVFAMYSGGVANGGFHFAIPLPGKHRKRSERFPVRFMLPEYFDWEYQAQATREYQERQLGQYYNVRPDENRSRRFFNPEYIKSNLIRIGYLGQ